MSNTHSIPSAASFDANPRCILPDAIIDPISDELQAIENLAERLRGHAEGHVHANDPRTLGQLDLLACSIRSNYAREQKNHPRFLTSYARRRKSP